MNELKINLLEFIEWAQDNSEDGFEIWDTPEKLVNRYIEYKKSEE